MKESNKPVIVVRRSTSLYQQLVYKSLNRRCQTQQEQYNIEDELDIKSKQLESLKIKCKKLQECNEQLIQTIKILENKLEEQEKMYNLEIVELKCNLDNSLFEECSQKNLQVIQEENEFYQKSFVNDYGNIIKLLDKIEDDSIISHNSEDYVLLKIKKLIEMIQNSELELEDWKRNYWILEKKFNQMLLNQEGRRIITNDQDIEVEYDFQKKKIITKHFDRESLIEEIKRLKSVNSQLINNQRMMAKQMVDQLKNNTHQKLTLVNEPGVIQKNRNQYFSQYFQKQKSQNNTDNSVDQQQCHTAYATPVANKQNNKMLPF